jgi:tetratricopeptide (TPR) repeat protein
VKTYSHYKACADAIEKALLIKGRYSKVLEMLQECLTVHKNLGPEDGKVAATLCRIGHVLSLQGKHSEALARLQECLAIQKKTLGPEDIELAETLFKIGCVLSADSKRV